MKTIFYPPCTDYDHMFQRPQQLLRRLAQEGWTVYFANVRQESGRPPVEVEPNLYVIRDFNAFLTKTPPITVLWISWPKYYPLKSMIKPALTIYDVIDDFPAWKVHEGPMIEQADVIITVSQPLYYRFRQHNKPTFLVRNGCDTEVFRPKNRKIPGDLEGLARPIIGFIGTLSNWVDLSLLEAVGLNFTTVVVGNNMLPLDPAKLHVHYLGQKPYETVADYYEAIDVGIIPFNNGTMAMGSNPIKMYEYLGLGKPVVATPIPECIVYAPPVRIGESIEEFLAEIGNALNEVDNVEPRFEVARKNSWEERTRRIHGILHEFLEISS